ncbi:MAG TPA: FAD-binding oxidoreductase [Candidatus Saccharimonadia bacterium]|nr:FAD-binding oxidoreductase [Candidatus Saccharimonadia bacterium]
MKQAYLKELASRLLGSVTDTADALEHFSTDQSIFTATPTAVIYPQNTADVRKTVQFSAERAAAGRPLPLVPRGKGSDQSGGAVGEGLQVVFPAHLNKLLRLDRDAVTVQPGILFQTMQQTLYTHGRFVAQQPAGAEYSTVGGLVATGSAGQSAVKYGSLREAVRGLKVVLADSSLIETSRISARELNRRKGFTTLEGEIYRRVDSLLLDGADLIKRHHLTGVPNTAGYDLWSVRRPNGSFDLTPLFIGSQGTLGIITEITLATLPYAPRTTLAVGFFATVAGAGEAVARLRSLGPCAIELVDRHVLDYYRELRPDDLTGLVPDPTPAITLLVEFDNHSQLAQKIRSTRAERIMRRHGATVRISTDPVEQVALWKIRRSTVATWLSHGSKHALPFIEDAAVPVEKLPQFIDKTYKLLRQHDLEPALWGHAGSGNLRLQPRLDLSKKKDVDKLFTLAREYAELVISLGGTPSASHGDNLLRATFLPKLYGEELYEILASVKHIFDPQDIFNPAQLTGATEDYARAHLRTHFTASQLHDYHVYT